jgi:hypothetical protein
LRARHLALTLLPELDDVDDFATAAEVASTIPGTLFATTVGAINAQLLQVAGSR